MASKAGSRCIALVVVPSVNGTDRLSLANNVSCISGAGDECVEEVSELHGEMVFGVINLIVLLVVFW